MGVHTQFVEIERIYPYNIIIYISSSDVAKGFKELRDHAPPSHRPISNIFAEYDVVEK